MQILQITLFYEFHAYGLHGLHDTTNCTITGTMLVPVHYIICTLRTVFFPEITVFVVVKIYSFQCQCQCQYSLLKSTNTKIYYKYIYNS